MDALNVFLPMDRRQALAAGRSLPDRVNGAALFADISGFTPLTAALVAELGRQRGAEALLDYLNPLLDALAGELHTYGGSVIGFAGDAITCWLDGDDGRRAVACALAMQAVMAPFARTRTPSGQMVELSVKVSVAAGAARRFLVGNPAIHNFEALAGATLERMAAAEKQAQRGEVLLSAEVAENLGDLLQIAAWRQANGLRYAVVGGLAQPVPPQPWPPLPPGAPGDIPSRPWIDAPVYERLGSGATFLAELRPVTALFLQFSGIDYDGDDRAGEKLDAYMRWVQATLGCYDGYLQVLVIGDKGCYLLAAFGAPVAHDDDEARAVAAALDLRRPPPELGFIGEVRLGLSQGLVWAGACGGQSGCIYTVIGEEVNLAARLMAAAAPGQVLVRQHIAQATQRIFRYRELGEVRVKGRAEPVAVAEAQERLGAVRRLASWLENPLVGRQAELKWMTANLNSAASGRGQVLRLVGAPGVGKSHLATTFIERAVAQGWQVAVGVCSSAAQGVPYEPWRQALLDLLDLEDVSPGEQMAALQSALLAENAGWALRLPLLGDVLGQAIPEEETTASLEPRQRQAAVFALVVEIVQAWAARRPLLLMLDDVHWMDEASQALALAVARGIRSAPALILAVQRPSPRGEPLVLQELDELPDYHSISLSDLDVQDVASLLRNRLGAPLSALALALVQARSRGNPFFAEELANALVEAGRLQERQGLWDLAEDALGALLDAGCLVKQEGEWRLVENANLGAAALDLPDSVNGVVLARLDRLEERYKLTLKTASVIGLAFDLDLLQAIHPAQPTLQALSDEIATLGRRDFVRLEAGGRSPVYMFKHNTTQEAIYATLLFAQRRALHSQVAQWYEAQYAPSLLPSELTLESPLAPHYPLLAHHWRLAEMPPREQIYAGLAGEQSARKYANESAVRFFSRAYELTGAADLSARYRLLLGREAALDVIGQREEQARDLAVLLELARGAGQPGWEAAVELRRARYADLTGDYGSALQSTQAAIALAQGAGDKLVQARAVHQWGRLLWKQGQAAPGRQKLKQALRLARRAGGRLDEARCYSDISATYREQANFAQALAYNQKAQSLYQELGYRQGEVSCLGRMAAIYDESGKYGLARQFYQQAVAACRAIGWRLMEATCLGDLGSNAFDLGDYEMAREHHERAMAINREMGNRHYEAINLDTLGLVHIFQGDHSAGLDCALQALALQQQLNDLRGQGYTLNHLGLAYAGLGQLDEARQSFEQALSIRRQLGQLQLTLDDLAGLARLELAAGEPAAAQAYAQQILAGIHQHGLDGTEFPTWVYLTCCQALLAAGQPEQARQALHGGRALLQERASQIADDDLRQQFLQEVPFNRTLIFDPLSKS